MATARTTTVNTGGSRFKRRLIAEDGIEGQLVDAVLSDATLEGTTAADIITANSITSTTVLSTTSTPTSLLFPSTNSTALKYHEDKVTGSITWAAGATTVSNPNQRIHVFANGSRDSAEIMNVSVSLLNSFAITTGGASANIISTARLVDDVHLPGTIPTNLSTLVEADVAGVVEVCRAILFGTTFGASAGKVQFTRLSGANWPAATLIEIPFTDGSVNWSYSFTNP